MFWWAENPWIPDSNARSLLHRKCNRVAVTTISSLAITRTGRTQYTVRPPLAPEFPIGDTVAKLQRWILAILLCSPRVKIEERIGATSPLAIRRPPGLSQPYQWTLS
ncbi:hypothetical protein JG688_00012965 [Phytophthora aleatoria]|uniref:Uncharacterized protein n=1 Tax=Phytophthora aleatoria TaxID=2496075 RepID=A0A8J5J2A4_9STRA|nr:hypothetical protein JG688_00012965 [Phytophthora aleatoria]